MGVPENAVQGVSGGVMEQEAQRLFGQKKSASTVETENGNLNLQKNRGSDSPGAGADSTNSDGNAYVPSSGATAPTGTVT